MGKRVCKGLNRTFQLACLVLCEHEIYRTGVETV